MTKENRMTFTTQNIVNALADDGMAVAACVELWRRTDAWRDNVCPGFDAGPCSPFPRQHGFQWMSVTRGSQLAHKAHCTEVALTPAEVAEAREIAVGHADQLAEILAQHLSAAA